MAALRTAEAKPFAPVRDLFEDVWAKPTPELQRQRQELIDHIERHPEHFAEKLTKYQDGKAGL